ncbi:30S ribosomal protein S1 [Pirellulimonas nuda]|uniref:30S ribosomal protein S1 n=1 Tax=Pirellulimonas nuda TaxID=2528009 RepID=A0A518D6I9_9BACT|nr:Tex-like N-terminal domain-containing protein [Pirellulimonas nuda]QDU87102.1 30S ribosomal protein S1 [Pirellulimonas nuda]
MPSPEVDCQRLARSLGLPHKGVRSVVALLDDGATAPFITRYRRDETGGMDEEQVVAVREALAAQRRLDSRKATVLRSLQTQGKLTDALRDAIAAADSIRLLDDLYLPFKPKKQSLAQRAREQGLGPLADEIVAGSIADLDRRAGEFVSEERGVASAAAALLGAGHILAERFAEDAALRQGVRGVVEQTGRITAKRATQDDKLADGYRDYWEYSQPLSRAPLHRVLAINRGEREGALRVAVEFDVDAAELLAVARYAPQDHPQADLLAGAARDAARRLLGPSLAREARRELATRAESHAVAVFARNLRGLLMQPPLPGRRVLAVDPGYKNGCKLAALDETGRVLETGAVYIMSDQQKTEARAELARMAREHRLGVIAIGNGSACRPAEELVAELIADELAGAELDGAELGYVIVNEAGASVYSTSQIGREELPDREAIQRSAVSIGRRLQDPLSELVKIDPASLGVGLYQHDANHTLLRDALDDVVRSCVSFVGVEVNSASPSLLRYVSGLNQLTARRICEHREQHGPFRSRQELRGVSGLGPVSFQQAAGFLKVERGDEPLDATWVHPEAYDAARQLLANVGVETAAIREPSARRVLSEVDPTAMAERLAVGRFAAEQLLDAMARPGRDPRAELPAPVFRRNVVRLDDLHPGMELRGTVVNVVDFGAFVDIGLSDSALVHVSQLSKGYVSDPHRVVSVGEQVGVWVTGVDAQRRRVSLTMIDPNVAPPPPAATSQPRPARKKTPKKPAPAPRPKGPPISDAMRQGAEPMRSFGDLLQYHERKKGG